MLLSHVFKQYSVRQHALDDAVWLLHKELGLTGLNKYPLRDSVFVDDLMGVPGNPFKGAGRLMQR
jgi:hypothetical protein